MGTQRISEDEASAVLRGQTPATRDDLAAVAHAVAEFRRASFDASPQPSAELALRLDLERAARISDSTDGSNASTAVQTLANEASAPRERRRSVVVSGFLGLGLAAKIAIGAGAAAAVGVTGAGAAGAAGVLPTEAQVVFNQVIGVEVDGEDASKTVEDGLDTAEEALLKAEEARKAALEKAEELRQSGIGTAEDATEAGVGAVDEAAETGLGVADEAAQKGLEVADDATQAGLEQVDEAGDIVDDVTDEATDLIRP
jgi:hypothetical protein